MGQSAEMKSSDGKMEGHEANQDDSWIQTVCYMCYGSCGIRAHKVNGKIIKIEGDERNPHNFLKVCAKGNAAMMGLYDPSRVKSPLIRTNPEKGMGIDPQWQEISWDEALDEI